MQNDEARVGGFSKKTNECLMHPPHAHFFIIPLQPSTRRFKNRLAFLGNEVNGKFRIVVELGHEMFSLLFGRAGAVRALLSGGTVIPISNAALFYRELH